MEEKDPFQPLVEDAYDIHDVIRRHNNADVKEAAAAKPPIDPKPKRPKRPKQPE